MSGKDFVDKVLNGVAVELKPLGLVAEYVRGLVYNKSSESSNGRGYKVLRANNITLASNQLNFDDIKVVNFDTKVKNTQKLYKNDILISAASGSREHVGKVAFIDANIDFYFGGFMGVVRCSNGLNSRYMFHVLTSDIFQKYLDEMLNSSTINNLNSTVMGVFKIPIPCPDNPKKSLEIQAEIVRILDAFTDLTAELTTELTTELTNRKTQYKYYLNQLLSFEDAAVLWKTLGEVIYSLKTGLNPRQNFQLNTSDAQGYYVTVREIQNGKVRFLEKTDRVNGQALRLINGRSNLDAGDVLFSGTGTVGRTAVIEDKPENWNIKEGVYVIKPVQEKLLPRYLAYLLNSSETVKEYSKKIVGNPVVSLPMGDLRNLKIPVPPLDKQARIVAILDKFDALTNSLIEGLPREIELRQKQYEYYRDLLLSFPKLKGEKA